MKIEKIENAKRLLDEVENYINSLYEEEQCQY